MRRGHVNYWEREQLAPNRLETDLPEVPVRYVPLALTALETRKARSFWLSDADWYEGYQALCQFQWGLLMGAREDLIREIRGVRGSAVVPDDTRLSTYGIGQYPGVQLRDLHEDTTAIADQIVLRLPTIQGTLEDIKRLLEAQEQVNLDEVTNLLGQIAALLAV